MEIWQRTRIRNNLAELIQSTVIDAKLLAILQSHSVVSCEEVPQLIAESQGGQARLRASKRFYDILTTRKSAYEILTKALINCGQTSAAKVLIDGFITSGIHNPLTHLDISLKTEEFNEKEIWFQRKKIKIKDLFSGHNMDNVYKIFKESLPEIAICDMLLDQQKPFVLAEKILPPEPPFYIPRFVSNQQKVGVAENRVYMAEDEFVNKQLAVTDKRVVCFGDAPGMGKTYLLASIARSLATKSPSKIVAFISVPHLFATIDCLLLKYFDNELAFSTIFRYISPTPGSADLLQNLVTNKILWMEVLFDGLDVIEEEKINWMKQLMKTILAKFRTVRIYVTSRPHMRNDLESTLGAIPYDIFPFNVKNQADFLTSFWLNKQPNIMRENIYKYASGVLNVYKENLFAEEFIGMPLQCMLIAEVFREEAYKYFNSKEHAIPQTPLNLCEMYDVLIRKRIRAVERNDAVYIKKLHLHNALALLFPDIKNGVEMEVPDDVIEKLYEVGIMEQAVNTTNIRFEFVHRTFAEYFVAEYFADAHFLTGTGRNYCKLTENQKNQEGIKYFLQKFSIGKPVNRFYLGESEITQAKQLVVNELSQWFHERDPKENGFNGNFVSKNDNEASKPLCESNEIATNLDKNSKWSFERSFVIIGLIYATTSLAIAGVVCILFASFTQQISTQPGYANTSTITHNNQEVVACSDDYYNKTNQYIITEEFLQNDTLKTFARTSEGTSSILLVEELQSLQIYGNVSSNFLVNVLSRTRCLRDLSFENAAVHCNNPRGLQKSNLRTENCKNVLPSLESLRFNTKCTNPDVWIVLEDCKMQYLKNIYITNMVFNDKVFRVLDLLQAQSPNLRFLNLHGYFENISSLNPLAIELPNIKEVHYDITKFNDTTNKCDTPLVLGNNFCKVFSSLEAFTSKKCLLFHDWFQIAGCKTLTRLDVKVQYTSNILHILNLAARFPKLKVAKIYLNFPFGCPDLVAFKNLEDDTRRDQTAKFKVTYCSNCPMIRRNVYCFRNG